MQCCATLMHLGRLFFCYYMIIYLMRKSVKVIVVTDMTSLIKTSLCLCSLPHSLVKPSVSASSITPSLFHARLKTCLYNKSFPYQGFIQLLLLSYSIVQANSFIFRWWYCRFCRVCTGFIASRSGKFYLVRHSFEAYKSPSARLECTGKSRYLSASIHFSTLIHCITPKPPLATHWMASTFQTGHLGV